MTKSDRAENGSALVLTSLNSPGRPALCGLLKSMRMSLARKKTKGRDEALLSGAARALSRLIELVSPPRDANNVPVPAQARHLDKPLAFQFVKLRSSSRQLRDVMTGWAAGLFPRCDISWNANATTVEPTRQVRVGKGDWQAKVSRSARPSQLAGHARGKGSQPKS